MGKGVELIAVCLEELILELDPLNFN